MAGRGPLSARTLTIAARTLALTLAAGLVCLAGCRSGVAPTFDEARAFSDLEKQVSFGPRVPGTEAHRRCREWLVETLGEAGGRVTVQALADTAFPYPGVDTLYNVRARFGPESGTYVLLGAHWDCRPFADRDSVAARRTQWTERTTRARASPCCSRWRAP
jgi:hypothetical protein